MLMSNIIQTLLGWFSNPIFTGVVGALGGVAGTLLTKFGEAYIQERFENRKRRAAAKIEAAHEINSYCTEGMHKGFRVKPGSEQHIMLKATDFEAIDEKVGKKLREFLAAWMMHRNFIKDKPSLEDTKMALEYRDKAQSLGEELLATARLWSK